MSRQKGLIKLEGKMNGIIFFRQSGVDYARMSAGPSKKKIMRSPAYRRMRENMSEFGGSAKAAKAFRLAIGEGKIGKAGAYLVGRLQKLFLQICKNGTGERGKRSIEVMSNRELVEGYEFNTETHFSSVFHAPYSIHTTAARDEATFATASFLPSSFVNAPAGATHFRVFAVLCALSDYVYDPVKKQYAASDPALDMLRKEEHSAMIDLDTALPVSLSLHAVLPGSPAMTGTVAAALLAGCEFFQRTGAVDYLLAEGDCMRVIKVF